MKAMGSHGSPSLLFMMKLKVNNTQKVMTWLIASHGHSWWRWRWRWWSDTFWVTCTLVAPWSVTDVCPEEQSIIWPWLFKEFKGHWYMVVTWLRWFDYVCGQVCADLHAFLANSCSKELEWCLSAPEDRNTDAHRSEVQEWGISM